MFKFVTIYRRVDDDDALETFFSTTHLPLAEKLHGLLKSEVSRIEGKPGGESRYHLMYELYFEGQEWFERALMTETGIRLMQALKPWADAKLVTWFYSTAYEEATATRRQFFDAEAIGYVAPFEEEE
ncbi:MAG: EthD family reductase [Anaerolineales bacterium]|nr:EthD family reductase [Anaerolineales bacterium]